MSKKVEKILLDLNLSYSHAIEGIDDNKVKVKFQKQTPTKPIARIVVFSEWTFKKDQLEIIFEGQKTPHIVLVKEIGSKFREDWIDVIHDQKSKIF